MAFSSFRDSANWCGIPDERPSRRPATRAVFSASPYRYDRAASIGWPVDDGRLFCVCRPSLAIHRPSRPGISNRPRASGSRSYRQLPEDRWPSCGIGRRTDVYHVLCGHRSFRRGRVRVPPWEHLRCPPKQLCHSNVSGDFAVPGMPERQSVYQPQHEPQSGEQRRRSPDRRHHALRKERIRVACRRSEIHDRSEGVPPFRQCAGTIPGADRRRRARRAQHDDMSICGTLALRRAHTRMTMAAHLRRIFMCSGRIVTGRVMASM